MTDEMYFRDKTIHPAINPIVFKAIFSKEENKDLLCSFLKAFLDIEETPETIELMHSALDPVIIDGRYFSPDVRLRTEAGDLINIEILDCDEFDPSNRNFFYAARLYVTHFEVDFEKGNFGKSLSLSLLCFSTEEHSKFLSHMGFVDTRTLEHIEKGPEMVLIELPSAQDEDLDELKKLWMTFLQPGRIETLISLKFTNELFGKAVEAVLQVNTDEKVRFALDMQHKATIDRGAREAKYKIDRDKILEEGVAIAREEMIRKACERGVDIPTIAAITSRTEEEIKRIRDESH